MPIDVRYSVDDFPHGVPVSGWCPDCRSEQVMNRHAIRASIVFAGNGTVGSVFRCARCNTNLARPSMIARILRTLLLLLCLCGLTLAFWVASRFGSEFLSNWREVGLTLAVVVLALVVLCVGATVAVVRALVRIWRSRFIVTSGYEVSM